MSGGTGFGDLRNSQRRGRLERETEQTIEGKITALEAVCGVDRGSSRGIIRAGKGAYARSTIHLRVDGKTRTDVYFPAILPFEAEDTIRCTFKSQDDVEERCPYRIEKIRNKKVVATYTIQ